MMHSFKLSHHRCANVWLDEYPNGDFPVSPATTRIFKPKITFETSRRIAVIELNVPQGPRTSYALLGVELVKSTAHDLEMSVAIKSEGSPYVSSIASKSDEIIVGLPNEYANAVFRGAEKIINTIGAPAKVAFQFHCAAHGLIGSSPRAFERVSELVMQLLTLPNNATEQHIMNIFE